MAQRTGELYIDPVLTNLSVAYQTQAFIADQLFPRVGNLAKPSGIYYKFGKEQFGPFPELLRAPGTRARETDWKVTTATYTTQEYALIGRVTDEDRRAQDAPIELDQNTVTNTTELHMLARELRVRDLLLDDSVYPSGHKKATLTGTNKWSDPASTPVKDVREARAALRKLGIEPNVMVIPAHVVDALSENASIMERIKYTQLGSITVDLLSRLFQIPTILTPASVYNTANAGQAANLVDLWGNAVWLGYVGQPALRTLSFGLTFEYRGRHVRRWREEDKRVDILEVSEEVGEDYVATEAGFLFEGVL